MKLEPSRESLAERSKDEKFFLRKYPRPAWLLEESDDFRWVFRRDVPGYAKSHYTVVWDFGEEHADLDLHRKRYWSELARTLAICYGASTGEKSRRVTSIIVFARSIRSFALWACFVRQCSSASVLSDEDISAYERHVEDLGLTEKSAHQKLSVISAIWNFREELDEKILIRPYRFQGELGKAAKRVGRTNGHTPTLEPESFFLLLEHSLALIDQGEKWIDLAEQYSQVRSSGVGRPSRKFKSITGECASNVITMARDVYGACIVLIFSMLGARKHEVALFQVSDAREYLDASDGLLGGRVTKSSNGAGGSKTERPLIPELHQAIGFVVSLTGIDIQNDSGALFRPIALDATLQSDATDELDTGKIYRLVERIAQLANIRMDVRPHMFRRAFSMIYIWRYELGDLHYLSRMLKHNDLTHTIAYTQGDDIKIFLMDAERDLARSIMERALTGKELLGGGFGSLLERVGRRIRANTTVLRPDQFDSWIEPRIRSGQFSIRPGPQGYCVILGDRAGKGSCSTDGKSVNLSNRTDEHCASCGNFLLTDRSKGYWQSRYDVHSKVAKLSKIDVVRKAALVATDFARRMIDSVVGKGCK